MSEEEEIRDNFEYDQPWNPVSYFEEENEATGGKPTGSAYSPSKLASLFETNRLAVDQDIAMRKRLNSQSNVNDDSNDSITNENENTDLDSLSQYTLEVDNGMKILDTTPAINRKAIFHDIDRLRRWKESVDNNPNKEVYVSDDETANYSDTGNYSLNISDNTDREKGNYSLNISDSTDRENENNKMDLDMDYILNSLPDITSFDSSLTNVNCYGKLNQLENQLNVNENLFSIGSTSGTSTISDKKNSVLEDDSELIINKIIIGDTVNSDISIISNISDLNRKNQNQNNESSNVPELTDVDTGHSSYIDSLKGLDLKGLDISDELDTLFDDIDEGLELPDVPEHEINCSFQDGGNLEEKDDNGNLELNNEIVDTNSDNDIDTNNDGCDENSVISNNNNNNNKDDDVTSTTYTYESLNTGPEVDCVDNTNTISIDATSSSSVDDVTDSTHSEDDLVENIISSNETDSVDAFIDYVDNITSSDFMSDRTEISDLDVGNTSHNIDVDSTLGDSVHSSILFNTNSESLAIESILDHIQSTEIDRESTEIHRELPDVTETSSELFSEETSELHEKKQVLEDLEIVKDELNPPEALIPPVDISEQETDNSVDVDAGSSTVDVDTVDSSSSVASDDTNTTFCSETSAETLLNENKSSERPIPIPKNVNVSSVLHKDSIGCLTPDDDEDLMVACSSGYNANRSRSHSSSDDEQPSTSTAGIEEENDSDNDELNNESYDVADVVKTEENESCSASASNNDENTLDIAGDAVSPEIGDAVSPEIGDAESPVSNIEGSNCEALVDSENITVAVDSHTENELVAATGVDAPSSSSNTTIACEEPSMEITESSTPEEDTTPDTVLDTDNSGISAAVFENPSDSSSSDTPQATTDTSVQQVPGVNQLTRSSGSIRRVRFSLDNEENVDNQDSSSSASGSFVEQPATSSQGNDNTSNPVADSTTEMRNLGWVAPKWIPDSDAKTCMTCSTRFTVVKRRHHCRACGKVMCSQCCNMKFHLPYMDYKPVRVCQACCDIMITALNGAAQGEQSQTTEQPSHQPPADPQTYPLPEAPPPYSETVERHSERLGSTSSNAPPYSEAAGPRFDEQPAEVMSAGAAMDNLPVMRNIPNQPINDMMSFQLPGYSSHTRPRNSRNRSESEMSAVIMFNSTVTNLPPILRRDNEETRIVNNPDLNILLKQMNDEEEDPIAFIVNKNLVVRVKVVNMDCCVERKCWCFVSDGMGASNQEEVVILIKCGSYDIDEIVLLRKVLQQMNAIFEKAKHGNAVSDSEQMELNENIRCMAKNIGMLFYKPTLQCIKKLFLPTSPYLFGMYIERSEVAWAKNFPLRLLLRIGAEFKYYPCPLFNVLNRPPVYDGVGRTILDLLADFRNFQYTLPRIVGVTINLRGKDTIIKLPRHRFDEVLKAVNAAEENVLSLAGNFSPTCDGHLVSVEKDGRYKTQTLSIVLKENRKVTCASFFVMSAALKPDQSGVKAKASIVEDGVMVQVTSEVIQEFKNAIKEMKEYTITAGDPKADDSSQVGIEWCSADSVDRPKLTSPIDATPFDNLTNMKIRHSYDYTSNNLTAKIHWVEVYFLPQDNDTTVQRLSARELGQMTSSIAKACMSALSPHLMTLIALEMTRIGLRVNLAANFVEYKIGANLTTLPPELLPTLDDKLVPAVHNVMSSAQERVAVELIFQLVKIV